MRITAKPHWGIGGRIHDFRVKDVFLKVSASPDYPQASYRAGCVSYAVFCIVTAFLGTASEIGGYLRQIKLKKQIRKLLAKKNNSQISREIGCSHGYVGDIRKLYNVKNPHRKPYGLLTKRQFLRVKSLYLSLKSLEDIIKELKLPYKTISGLYFLLRRKGVKRKGRARAWIKFNPEKFRGLLNKNLNKAQIAKEMGIHEIQMYRYWGKYIKAIK